MKNKLILVQLIDEIESARIKLNKLIAESEHTLVDKEIIKVSELLDQLLLKYHNLK